MDYNTDVSAMVLRSKANREQYPELVKNKSKHVKRPLEQIDGTIHVATTATPLIDVSE